MASPLIKLDPHEESGLQQWIDTPGDYDPGSAFRAMGKGVGSGKYPSREELEPTFIDRIADKIGYKTEKLKHIDELTRDQGLLKPFVSKLIQAKMERDWATKNAPPIGVAQSQYGLVPDASQMLPGPEVEGPGAPMATGLQPGQGFDPQELQQPMGNGQTRLEQFQTQADQRGAPYVQEGPRPIGASPGVNASAPLLPYQVSQLQPLMEGRAVMQDGRFVPTPIARPSENTISGAEANQHASNIRDALVNAGVPESEAPPTLHYHPDAKVSQRAFEAHMGQLASIGQKMLESRQNRVLNQRNANLASAQIQALSLPKSQQTDANFARIAKQFQDVLPEDIKKAFKEPNTAPIQLNINNEKKYGETFANKIAERDTTLMDTAEKASDNATRANRVLQVLNSGKVITGTGAEFRLQFAKAMKLAGLSHDDSIENTEVLSSELANNTLAAIKASGLGAGNGFSNADRDFLEKAVGGKINLEPATLKRLAMLAYNISHLSAERWNARVKQIPSSALEGAGMSTNPVSVPPIQIGSDADYNLLPKGARFIGPGESVVRVKP